MMARCSLDAILNLSSFSGLNMIQDRVYKSTNPLGEGKWDLGVWLDRHGIGFNEAF